MFEEKHKQDKQTITKTTNNYKHELIRFVLLCCFFILNIENLGVRSPLGPGLHWPLHTLCVFFDKQLFESQVGPYITSASSSKCVVPTQATTTDKNKNTKMVGENDDDSSLHQPQGGSDKQRQHIGRRT